ncbi:MAG: UbiA family prenyltransferase [Methanobacterium sp.]
MNAYLEIIRPGNAIMAVIAVLLIAIISGIFTIKILLACIVVFIITGAGNSINDYFDYKIDAINKPERPIPSGRISLNKAGFYSLALLLIGTILAFILGLLPGLIALSTALLMVYYAYSLKKKFLIGNIVISFLTGLTFVFGGVIVGEILTSIILGFFPFLTTLAREIVKDMEDVEGDRIEGATTLPIMSGMRISSIIAAFFLILASLSSPILYYLGILTIFYIPLLIIAVLIFLYYASSILKDQSIKNARNVSNKLKIGMLIILIAYGLGSPFLASLL